MRVFWAMLVGVGLTCGGCAEQPVPEAAGEGQAAAAPNASPETAAEELTQAPETPAAETKSDAAPTAETAGKTIPLSAENTEIQFVCAHVGEKPDPRKGHFSTLTGKATVDGDALAAIEIEIDAASLTTEIDKLTDHLKSPDFFDVRKHPKATFKSTSIEKGESGQVKVTGDLTLLGTTKSISFPATVDLVNGLSLKAEFKVDRTEFGMNYGADKVEKLVDLTVTVSK